MTGHVDKHLQI